jgi:hypothetical protein
MPHSASSAHDALRHALVQPAGRPRSVSSLTEAVTLNTDRRRSRPTHGLYRLGLAVSVALWFVLFTLGGTAQAIAVYGVCDHAQATDYPLLLVAPHGCDLGLGQSYYQAQPVRGRSFTPLGLRGLRWSSWGGYQAVARGLSCDVRPNGSVKRTTCDHVTVNFYNPVSVLPAGGAVIYQLMRVFHPRTQAEPYRYGYWYQPGTDY